MRLTSVCDVENMDISLVKNDYSKLFHTLKACVNSFYSEYLLNLFFPRNYNMTNPHIKLWKTVLVTGT